METREGRKADTAEPAGKRFGARQQAEKLRLATGRVGRISKQPGRYAVKVGGEWLSAFEKDCPVLEGQDVVVAYVEDGRWKNIKAIEILEDGLPGLSENVPKGLGPYESGRQKFVARCVGLKSAAAFYANEGAAKSSDLVKLAEALARWLLRDSTQEAASGESIEAENGVAA